MFVHDGSMIETSGALIATRCTTGAGTRAE